MSLRLAAAYSPYPKTWRSPRRAQHTVRARRCRANQVVGQKLAQAAVDSARERTTARLLSNAAALGDLVTGLVRYVIGRRVLPAHRRWLISRPQRVEPPLGP